MIGGLMKVPQANLVRQYESIKSEIDEAVLKVLGSGKYIFWHGNEVKSLETEMANYCGVKHAIGVASGTDALTLPLRAIGIGPGDKVITTTFTFLATPEVIANLDAHPVFVDIDPDAYNIDSDKIAECIEKNSSIKAIMPVHLYGQAADMDEIMQIAKDRNIQVIEDAAQAVGAKYNGRPAGSLGDMAGTSFFPTKNLGAYGDGGMVFTNDDELYEVIASLRVHGVTKKDHQVRLGYNSRLDEIQGAILRVKLKYLDKWNHRRQEIAEIYKERLNEYVEVPRTKQGRTHIFHQYGIRVRNRDALRNYLKENGIGTGVHYPVPCHLQPAFEYLGYRKDDFPVAEKVAKELISLPIYPDLKDDEVEYVCEIIRKFYKK